MVDFICMGFLKLWETQARITNWKFLTTVRFESPTFRLRSDRANHCASRSDNIDKFKVDRILPALPIAIPRGRCSRFIYTIKAIWVACTRKLWKMKQKMKIYCKKAAVNTVDNILFIHSFSYRNAGKISLDLRVPLRLNFLARNRIVDRLYSRWNDITPIFKNVNQNACLIP